MRCCVGHVGSVVCGIHVGSVLCCVGHVGSVVVAVSLLSDHLPSSACLHTCGLSGGWRSLTRDTEVLCGTIAHGGCTLVLTTY